MRKVGYYQESAAVFCSPLNDFPSQSSLNQSDNLSCSESDTMLPSAFTRGENSVSDHTGLHPISLHSELELFSLTAKSVCSRRKYMCNANVLSLHGMAICMIKFLFFQ